MRMTRQSQLMVCSVMWEVRASRLLTNTRYLAKVVEVDGSLLVSLTRENFFGKVLLRPSPLESSTRSGEGLGNHRDP